MKASIKVFNTHCQYCGEQVGMNQVITCLKCGNHPGYQFETDPQQSTNEEIRQAFEKEDLSDYLVRDKPVRNLSIKARIYTGYEIGYKARDKSAQAEIENIKEWNAKVFKKKDAEIEELKEKLTKSREHVLAQLNRITELEQEAKDAAAGYQSALDNIHKELECCGNCDHSKNSLPVLYKQVCSYCEFNTWTKNPRNKHNWKQRRSHEQKTDT